MRIAGPRTKVKRFYKMLNDHGSLSDRDTTDVPKVPTAPLEPRNTLHGTDRPKRPPQSTQSNTDRARDDRHVDNYRAKPGEATRTPTHTHNHHRHNQCEHTEEKEERRGEELVQTNIADTRTHPAINHQPDPPYTGPHTPTSIYGCLWFGTCAGLPGVGGCFMVVWVGLLCVLGVVNGLGVFGLLCKVCVNSSLFLVKCFGGVLVWFLVVGFWTVERNVLVSTLVTY